MTSVHGPQLTVDPSTTIELKSPVEGLLDELDVLLVVQTQSRVAKMDG